MATDATAHAGAGPLILALDAASPRVSVAVGFLERAPLAVRAVALEHSSTQLLALIDEVLGAAGLRPADLGGLVAAAGPGSFTGLRVALATALGLHQALGIPARTIPTLAALAVAAEAAPAAAGMPAVESAAAGTPAAPQDATGTPHPGASAPPGVTVAAVDALRGEWSVQAFRTPAGEPAAAIEPLTGIELVPASRLQPWLAACAATAAGRAAASLAAAERSQLAASPAPSPPPAPPALSAPAVPRLHPAPAAQSAPLVETPVTLVAFGVDALATAAGIPAGTVRLVDAWNAAPLAAAALRLAAAVPLARWQPASLAAPIYARQPATTAPRPRRAPASRSTTAGVRAPAEPPPEAAVAEPPVTAVAEQPIAAVAEQPMTAAAEPAPVRRAGDADLPAIAALEAAAFGDPWSASLLAEELHHPAALVLLAGLPGASPVAAYACFHQVAGEAELLRVATHPGARRRGLACRLIAAGLDMLRAAGVSHCFLEVRPDNTAALAIYHGLGFQLAGRRARYYRDGADALIYRLTL